MVKRKNIANRKYKKIAKPNVDMLLKKLPNVKVNKRKDRYVKFLEGNC